MTEEPTKGGLDQGKAVWGEVALHSQPLLQQHGCWLFRSDSLGRRGAPLGSGSVVLGSRRDNGEGLGVEQRACGCWWRVPYLKGRQRGKESRREVPPTVVAELNWSAVFLLNGKAIGRKLHALSFQGGCWLLAVLPYPVGLPETTRTTKIWVSSCCLGARKNHQPLLLLLLLLLWEFSNDSKIRTIRRRSTGKEH